LEDKSAEITVQMDGEYQSFTQPKYGTVTINPDGTFSYKPNDNFFGKDSFFVNVKNPDGSITKIPVTIDVEEVNDAPEAEDMLIGTPENVPVEGFFKATDIDGDQLTYEFVGTDNPLVFVTENGGKLTI